MSTVLNTYNPDYAVHPGEYLEEILETREIKQRDLAERMGIKETYLSHLLKGNKPVGPETALKLERVLGISSQIWSNMNAHYRLFEAQMKEKEQLLQKTEWVKEFPLAWLKKMGFIPNTRKSEDLVEAVLDFFAVSSSDTWEDYYAKQAVAYRKSETYTNDLKASATWLRAAELLASEIETSVYNEKVFKDNLKEIKKLTLETPENFQFEMKRLCAEAGVAFVCLPPPSKMPVYGATKWITSNKAMIVLSLRQKSDDQFWFSFFHEAAHVLLHSKKNTFIDSGEMPENSQEDEANEFSRQMLIDPKVYSGFVSAYRDNYYESNIQRFASQQGIAPGIVVGFLHHDKLMPYRFGQKLKRIFEFVEK